MNQHYKSDGHWLKDVTFRVHMGFHVYNRLMEPMNLSENQLADFRSRLQLRALSEGLPFLNECCPSMHRLVRECHSSLWRPVWEICCAVWVTFFSCDDRCFCTTSDEREPVYNLRWSRSETVVISILFIAVGLFDNTGSDNTEISLFDNNDIKLVWIIPKENLGGSDSLGLVFLSL